MMMRFGTTFATLAFAALVACSSEAPQGFAVETAAPVQRIGIRYSDVLVREVSLPTYAASETIVVAAPDGSLSEASDAVWADDPTRAVTLGLAQALMTITRARVSPDPWPFRDNPDATVDVRLETFVPGTNGVYTATGQYFVAPDDEAGRDRAVAFRLFVPFDAAAGQSAVAGARARLVSLMAEDIARRGLR